MSAVGGMPNGASTSMPKTNGTQVNDSADSQPNDKITRFSAPTRPTTPYPEHLLFHPKTRCFVYGLQPRAVQGMLDFDFICKRKTPSVAGIIYTFGGQFVSKMYVTKPQRRCCAEIDSHMQVLGNQRDSPSSLPICRKGHCQARRCRHHRQLCFFQIRLLLHHGVDGVPTGQDHCHHCRGCSRKSESQPVCHKLQKTNSP